MQKYILMAVAGMLALSSCSNGDDEPVAQDAPRQMTFTAAYNDGASTRATLGFYNEVSFEADDAISILSANNTNTKFTTSAGGATATFTGTASADTKFYAVHPYTDGLTLDPSTGVISGIEIPTNQSQTSNLFFGWNTAGPIAYATTTGTSLTFHHACALLKIYQDRGDGIRLKVYAYGGNLTGTFSLDTSNGSLSGGTETEAIVYNAPNNRPIFFAIAPGKYTGFTCTWERGMTNYGGIQKSVPVTFEAGKIYDLGKTSDIPDFSSSSPARRD